MSAICLDIDNVIADTYAVLRRVIHNNSGQGVDLDYEDVVCFEYWICRDKKGNRITNSIRDTAEWNIIHSEFTRNHLLEVKPYPNVKDHLENLIKRFDIHLATSRLQEGQATTEAWLSLHNIPHTQLHHVRHGQKHLIDHPFLVAVEDDREQAYAFHNVGIKTFLLAHPWNYVGPHSPINRVEDWDKLIEELASL